MAGVAVPECVSPPGDIHRDYPSTTRVSPAIPPLSQFLASILCVAVYALDSSLENIFVHTHLVKF